MNSMLTEIRGLTMDKVFGLKEKDLQKAIADHFKAARLRFIQSDDFLYYSGTFPVLLVAHMDTVHKYSPTICKSANGNVWMAPEGIGGDDRCGIWIILNILERFDCSVLFTQGEETGAIGAKAFASSGIIPSVNYMIEVDRQSADDAVFYSCGNKAFRDFILDKTDYTESYGSFSDISILSPHFDLASVNLSSGYYSPHDNSEFIILTDMEKTMQAVEYTLSVTDKKKVFKYEKEITKSYGAWDYTSAFGGKAASKYVGKYTNGYSSYDYDWDDDDDYYTGKTLKAADKPKASGVATAEPKVAESKIEYDEEFYKQLEEQEKQDDFEQMMFDETEDYLKAVTNCIVDEITLLDVAVAVSDILTTSGYLPLDY